MQTHIRKEVQFILWKTNIKWEIREEKNNQ